MIAPPSLRPLSPALVKGTLAFLLAGLLFGGGFALSGHLAGQRRAALLHDMDSLRVARQADSVFTMFERRVMRQVIGRVASDAHALAQQAEQDRQRADAAVRTVQHWRAEARRAVTSADSLPVLVALVAAQDTAIQALTAENTGLRVAFAAEQRHSATLRLALASADSATDRALRRAGELDSLVRSRLAPPPSQGKWLGFLPRPSRTLAFVGGAILGFVAHEAIR